MMRKPTPEQEELLEEIKGLRADLKDMKKRAQTAEEKLELQDQIGKLEQKATDLKKKIETDQIERDRQVETHEREKRELEHMIGLEKQRQEFEVAAAKREATLGVREENLDADRARFEKHLEFVDERFKAQETYLKNFVEQIMSRLPTVNVDRIIGGGNGSSEKD